MQVVLRDPIVYSTFRLRGYKASNRAACVRDMGFRVPILEFPRFNITTCRSTGLNRKAGTKGPLKLTLRGNKQCDE